MFLNILANLFIFIFGLCIGSFLNCVIYRLEQSKKLNGRSFCPNCRHTLSWKDLFPVFSYLFLGRKCRYCKTKISWQYPAVEVATGIIFVLMFLFLGFEIWEFIDLLFLFYIASSLIIIFVYDLKHCIIPDKVLLPAILITFVYQIFANLIIFNYVIAALIASGFFFVIYFFSKGKWMGFGDVKLAILMGVLLGLKGVLAALFLAFLFGAIISIILIAFYGKKLKSEVPFGPFLIAGTFAALFWGQQIIQWYLNILQI